MFLTLYKKYFTYLKRSYIGTSLQILLPLLLCGLLTYLVSLIDSDKFPQKNYPTQNLITSLDSSTFPSGFVLRKFMKQCNGAKIALSPRNSVTNNLSEFFKKNKYQTQFFINDHEINEFVRKKDYGKKYKNGTQIKLCFGLSFTEFDPYIFKYSYNLRFNISKIPQQQEHFETFTKRKKLDFMQNYQLAHYKNMHVGTVTLQTLVNSLILQQHSSFDFQNISYTQMPTPRYKYKQLFYFVPAVAFIFILSVLIGFVRSIGYIVSEREARCIENLENMGVSKTTYFLSSFCGALTFQMFMGIMITLFMRINVIQHCNIFLVFGLYFTFASVMQIIAFIVSTFFVSTKKAIIAGICVFIGTEVPFMMREKFRLNGPEVVKWSTLSPVAGMGQILNSFMLAESSFRGYNFEDLFKFVDNYHGIFYFTVMFIEFVVGVILGVYFFHVVPLEVGVAKHPLYFLSFLWKKKKQKKRKLTQDMNSENGSLFLSQSEEHEENRKKPDPHLQSFFFEPQTAEMQQKLKNSDCLILSNLQKVYKNKTVAVKNLNLSVFKDEIFVLLGHNGAGKTTTISMISGMITPSNGKIEIFGHDHIENRSKVKKIIGICTQHNIIFDYLTVKEHLILYAKVKGFRFKGSKEKQFLDKQIHEILLDIDLLHKKNDFAKNLSGGQKRKLQVAIAFVGNSKVILLDEPTSGMDAYARRLLWEMIKKYKKNRLILITTHNMDEADFLGDRIAIMGYGKLLTCGSSFFLKKLFGAGYDLTVVKKREKKEYTAKKIEGLLQKICKNTKIHQDMNIEIKFKLDERDKNQFSELFQYLEKQKKDENGYIQTFGISLTTLEDVFLKVAEIGRKKGALMKEFLQNKSHQVDLKQEEKFQEQFQSSDDSPIENESLEIQFKQKNLIEVPLHEIRNKSRFKTSLRQFGALIKKRLIYFSRDKQGLTCEIVVPLILFLLGYLMTKLQFVYDPPTFENNYTQYPLFFSINKLKNQNSMFNNDFSENKNFLYNFVKYNIPIKNFENADFLQKSSFIETQNELENHNLNNQKLQASISRKTSTLNNDNEDMTRQFIKNLHSGDKFKIQYLYANSVNQFSKELDRLRSDDQNYSFYLENFTHRSYNISIFTNSTAVFSDFVANDVLHNTLLKFYTKNSKAEINSSIRPFVQTSQINGLKGTINGIIMHGFIVSGYIFLAASMIVIIIKERQNRAKYQQLLSGTNLFSYWLSNFIVDYIKFWIPSGIILALIFGLDFNFFTKGDRALMTVLMFIGFGYNCVLWVYLLSFMFRGVGKGQIFTFVYVYLIVIFLTTLSLVLRIFPATRNLSFNYLEFIFRLFPTYSFSFSLMNMANFEIYQFLFAWKDKVNAFDWNGCLWDLIFMYANNVILLVLVVFCELRHKFAFLVRKKKRKIRLKENSNDLHELLIDERNKNTKKSGIRKNQRNLAEFEQDKSAEIEYQKTLATEKDALDIKVQNLVKIYNNNKLAVNDISFSLNPGQIMGFLGTNGAGKSTTFKILTGQIFPTSGHVYINGKEMPESVLDIRKYLGYCSQTDSLIQKLTAKEHLELFAELKGINPKYKRYLVDEMLKRMNLWKYKDIQTQNYSGGNKRKLSVALALLGNPSIILLDEPSAGMDPESRRFMWKVISQMSKESKRSSILLTTHSMEEAEVLATKIAIIVEGEIKTVGSLQYLKETYGKHYELDLKLHAIDQERLLQIESSLQDNLDLEIEDSVDDDYDIDQKSRINLLNNLDVDLSKAKIILKYLGFDHLIQEIMNNSSNEFFVKELQNGSKVGLKQLLQWAYGVERLQNVQNFLQERFDVKLIEYFRQYASFWLNQKNLLSQIFEVLEKEKENLFIQDYTIKQISLEQIFMKFADNNEHKD